MMVINSIGHLFKLRQWTTSLNILKVGESSLVHRS